MTNLNSSYEVFGFEDYGFSSSNVEDMNKEISKSRLDKLKRNYSCILTKISHSPDMWFFKCNDIEMYTNNPKGLAENAYKEGHREILFGRYDTDMNIDIFLEMDKEVLENMYQASKMVTANIL